MPSYAVTGATRGIGLGFARILSSNPENTVFALVRNTETTKAAFDKEFPGRKNVHIIKADMVDYESLKKAAAEVERITGGALDVLIANAGIGDSTNEPIGDCIINDPKSFDSHMLSCFQTNALSIAHLIAYFLPLIRRGTLKRIAVLSSGLSDADFAADHNLYMNSAYSVSKSAVNMVVAKYHAQMHVEGSGILVIGLCPGVVATEFGKFINDASDPKYQKALKDIYTAGIGYNPDFKPLTPDESVNALMRVMDNATIATHGGKLTNYKNNRMYF